MLEQGGPSPAQSSPGRSFREGQHECPEVVAGHNPSNGLWASFGEQLRQAPGVLPLHLRAALRVVEARPVASGVFGELSSVQGSEN